MRYEIPLNPFRRDVGGKRKGGFERKEKSPLSPFCKGGKIKSPLSPLLERGGKERGDLGSGDEVYERGCE